MKVRAEKRRICVFLALMSGVASVNSPTSCCQLTKEMSTLQAASHPKCNGACIYSSVSNVGMCGDCPTGTCKWRRSDGTYRCMCVSIIRCEAYTVSRCEKEYGVPWPDTIGKDSIIVKNACNGKKEEGVPEDDSGGSQKSATEEEAEGEADGKNTSPVGNSPGPVRQKNRMGPETIGGIVAGALAVVASLIGVMLYCC